MFASLDSLLSRYTERCFTPYIGGEFNARLGDLNGLSSWKYSMNVDEYINRYGRIYMTNIHGRKDVTLFKIIKTNWHMSDHRQIQLNI